MKRKIPVALALILALTSASLWSQDVKFAFRPVPPYVMADAANNVSGLEYEIIVAAFQASGHKVIPVLMPLARVVQTFKDGGVDAAAPILPSTNSGGTLTEVYLVYNNVALGLKSKNLKIASIADLKGRAVVAFQTATKALGPDFAAAVEGNPKYAEEADQVTQIRLLFGGRVDLAVGESRILAYFAKAPATNVDSSIATEEFRIFPPTNYRVACKDPKIAADFNAGLASIKKNGTYDAIVAKYSK